MLAIHIASSRSGALRSIGAQVKPYASQDIHIAIEIMNF